MHVQTDNADVRLSDNLLGEFQHGIDVQAELDAFDAGVGLGMRFGRQIGIDVQGHQGSAAQRMGHFAERRQFAFTFNIEEKDIVEQRLTHFGIGLADPGEDDFAARASGPQSGTTRRRW